MSDQVKQYLASIGARGGKAGTGKSKARTKSQARAAAKARWNKARTLREKKQMTEQPPNKEANK